MIRLSDIKRQLYRYDREIDEVMTLGLYVMAYCMQVALMGALVVLLCSLIVLWGKDLSEILLATSLVFLISGAFFFVLSLWFLRAALKVGEVRRPARKQNGRYTSERPKNRSYADMGKGNVRVKKVARVNQVRRDGTQDYLVDGKLVRYDVISGNRAVGEGD